MNAELTTFAAGPGSVPLGRAQDRVPIASPFVLKPSCECFEPERSSVSQRHLNVSDLNWLCNGSVTIRTPGLDSALT
jgi:hypothetical protein